MLREYFKDNAYYRKESDNPIMNKLSNVGLAMTIVCILGIIGNIAAIVVFTKPERRRRNFYMFMFYLAVFDLLYIVVAILVFILPQLSVYYKSGGLLHYIVPWAIPVGQVSMSGSVLFTTVITIERYLTVCHPFYMLSRDWSSKWTSIGIIMFAVLYNIPKFFEVSTAYEQCYFKTSNNESVLTVTYSSSSCQMDYFSRHKPVEQQFLMKQDASAANDTSIVNESILSINESTLQWYRYDVVPSAMRLNSLYVQVYAVYLNLLVNGIFPFALVITLNILILRELQKLGKSSSPSRNFTVNSVTISDQPSTRRKREIAIAKLSLTLAVIFILCHSVKWVPNIHEIIMHIQHKVPSHTSERQNSTGIVTSFNLKSHDLISTNDSFLLKTKDAKLLNDDDAESSDSDYWPTWVKNVTCISHLSITVNSSVNFFIYYIKRKALNSGQINEATTTAETQQLNLNKI